MSAIAVMSANLQNQTFVHYGVKVRSAVMRAVSHSSGRLER